MKRIIGIIIILWLLGLCACSANPPAGPSYEPDPGSPTSSDFVFPQIEQKSAEDSRKESPSVTEMTPETEPPSERESESLQETEPESREPSESSLAPETSQEEREPESDPSEPETLPELTLEPETEEAGREPLPSESQFQTIPQVPETEPSSQENWETPTESEPTEPEPTEPEPGWTAAPSPGGWELSGERLEGVDYDSSLPVPDWVGRSGAPGSLAMEYGGYYVKNPSERVVYLTFCMDYENGYTYQMMDTLASKGVSGAFFITGTYLSNRPDMAAALLNRGHILGSHSYRHRYTSELSDVELINDFVLSQRLFSQVLGYNLRYYRPAYGFIMERDMYLAQKFGLISTMFSFYYKDYDLNHQPGKWEALEKLKSGLQQGAVYYLHVTPCNIQALPDFIDYARGLGYQFLRLDQNAGWPPAPTAPPETAPAPPQEPTNPPETSPSETQPEESEPPETLPEESEPPETQPEETDEDPGWESEPETEPETEPEETEAETEAETQTPEDPSEGEGENEIAPWETEPPYTQEEESESASEP